MQFGPSLNQSVLASWQRTRNYLYGVNAIYSHIVLVVRVKMRDVMWRADFYVHPDDDAKEPAEFGHGLILSAIVQQSKEEASLSL